MTMHQDWDEQDWNNGYGAPKDGWGGYGARPSQPMRAPHFGSSGGSPTHADLARWVADLPDATGPRDPQKRADWHAALHARDVAYGVHLVALALQETPTAWGLRTCEYARVPVPLAVLADVRAHYARQGYHTMTDTSRESETMRILTVWKLPPLDTEARAAA